jgi:hypothetical protein
MPRVVLTGYLKRPDYYSRPKIMAQTQDNSRSDVKITALFVSDLTAKGVITKGLE